jgi:transposase
MMAQNDLVVVGIDVAKDKVDACIRAFKLRQTWPSTAPGQRKLVAWLRKHQVNKAVMEASGGYERAWALVLREAGIEVRIVDPSGSAVSRCRPDGWPRTMRSTRR